MRHWVREAVEEALSSSERPSARLVSDLKRTVEVIEELDWHFFRTVALDEIAGQVSECDDFGTLVKFLKRAATELGFDHGSIFVLRQGNGQPIKNRVCTTYPKEWLKRYKRNGYQSLDPVISFALHSNQPFSFSQLPNKVPMVQAFWRDAEAYGVGRMGLGFSFDSSESGRIGVSFSSLVAEEDFNESARISGRDAHVMANLLSEAFVRASGQSPKPLSRLSTSELQFLFQTMNSSNPGLLSDQSRRKQFGVDLQSSILNKLGVNNLLQAISVASSNKWFDELPYDALDLVYDDGDQPHLSGPI